MPGSNIIRSYIMSLIMSFCLLNIFAQNNVIQPDISANAAKDLKAAVALRENGKYDEAIERIKTIINRNPNYYSANYEIGIALSKNGQYDASIEYFLKAEKIALNSDINDNTKAALYNSLGWTYYLNGDLIKSEKYLQSSIGALSSLDPDLSPKILNNLGMLYFTKGDLKNSRKFFNQSKNRFNSSLAIQKLDTIDKIEDQLKNK